jgi:acetyl esterase/lipase
MFKGELDMFKTIKYGEHQSQIGDLYFPSEDCLGTICLLHGGFWKMPYDKSQLNEISNALSSIGYCVWNIEYRRTGEYERIWSDTFDDAVTSIQFLRTLKRTYPNINIDNVIVAGHSAGGHLALWLSTQEIGVPCSKFIGLAPILDLKVAFYENAGGDSVLRLIEGSPQEYPERYKKVSPIELINQARDQIILHGIEDEDVPIEWSRRYINVAKEHGRNFEISEIDKCGHMEFLEPQSIAFQKFIGCLSK